MGMRKILAVMVAAVAAGSVSGLAGQTNSGTIEVPLRVDGGRLLVPIDVADGTQLEFVLSTGGNPTVLSESTAARVGTHALSMAGVPLYMEGSVTLPDADLTTSKLTIAGMIGPQSLSDFDVLVDVPGGRLVLRPIGPPADWEGMTLSDPVWVRVLHGVLMGLDVEMNRVPFKAMLDLGMPSLIVNAAAESGADVSNESADLTVGFYHPQRSRGARGRQSSSAGLGPER
jgi:hypothetical protein